MNKKNINKTQPEIEKVEPQNGGILVFESDQLKL